MKGSPIWPGGSMAVRPPDHHHRTLIGKTYNMSFNHHRTHPASGMTPNTTIATHISEALNFNFANLFNHRTEIKLANDDSSFAYGDLQITPVDLNSIDRQVATKGQAIYAKPFHLWDNRSGDLADFTTTFTFSVSSFGEPEYADGFTFFLAENNTAVAGGGYLGLPYEYATATRLARFVAVEFDTYGTNTWDPYSMGVGEHVGIDVNSLTSAVYAKWLTKIPLGLEYSATVSYDSASKVLSVVFTGYQNKTRIQQDALRYTVDLRKELPEWVIFGFGAGTGGSVETHTIKSWSFRSTNLRP